jgi:DNA-binding response OmpR family regulator
MTQILVVDDDLDVREALEGILKAEGYAVDTVPTGAEALAYLEGARPDLIVLDIIMPGMDGLSVCERIRSNPFTASIPIIFLTAKGRSTDIAHGLDVGGDDYITKPFQVIELPARVRALLRRVPGGPLDSSSEYLTTGDLQLHRSRFEVTLRDEDPITLTATEHRLLHSLMMHAGQPISITALLQQVWDYPEGVGDPSLVHVHIRNLRKKIEDDPKNPERILNVYGRGYLVEG